MSSPLSATQTRKPDGATTARETLTITDNRTGKSYEIPVTHGTIRAADLRQIKVDPKEFGLMSYDPAFYNDAKDIFSPESRKKQTYRLIGKMPTIAAFAYRHTLGMPYVYPDNDLSYPGNFLNMLFRTSEAKYRPNPTLERALDILFILHADHEQNCSANTIRSVGSSHVDPYSATAAAIAALYGPLH